MIRSGERSLTEVALERLLSRVLPIVPRELVASRKLPGTRFPCACVGLFT